MQEIIIKGFDTEVKIPKTMKRSSSGLILDGNYGYERAEWLLNNVGPGRPGLSDAYEVRRDYHVWYSQVWFGYVLYHFKREADATMFKLKFG